MADDTGNESVFSLIASASQAAPQGGIGKRALQAIRSHLGMEVAYVSEFVDDRSVFREVDAPGLEALIKVGDSRSLDDVYCRHILEGRLPQLIPDTANEPIAMAMPITHAVPIGKHVSVPITLADGRVHGMFCCLGPKADHSLHERDLQLMKVFADLTAFEISRDLEASKAVREKEGRISDVIRENRFSIVYQPICKLETMRPVGFECLMRFSASPARSPDKWFAEAAETGRGTLLELAAIRMALSAISSFPADVYLAVNASPETVMSGELQEALDGIPGHRIVLEVTEHAHITDYERLLGALQPLRSRGVRLAVDDAGAGYSSLQHILNLRPDAIKLDMGLTRGIDADPARKALASALIGFARETGSRIIAEGVETASELSVLRAIGVEMAQGYFLGRPTPLESAAALCSRTKLPADRVA